MPGIGTSIRYCIDSRQGGRKYMEDVVVVKSIKEGENEAAYLAVFDGHGGPHAAQFAKEHLLDEILKHKGFWSDDDMSVMKAIKEGFMSCHNLMWKVYDKWPKTASGYPSTAGTTATVMFLKNGKMYVGHVGDSGAVLGIKDPGKQPWRSHCITIDHKPESPEERNRIESVGGSVLQKAGVNRVVWNRPKHSHQGPVRRSTHIDRIPFLAVARSLGDLWSYNSQTNEFVVSPEPDVRTYKIDVGKHQTIVLASDGLWNMLSSWQAVTVVQELQKECEECRMPDAFNPAKALVEEAFRKWSYRNMRADNTSVIVAMLYPEEEGVIMEQFPSERCPSTCSTIPATDEDNVVETGVKRCENLTESELNSSPDIDMDGESDSPSLSLPPQPETPLQFNNKPSNNYVTFAKPTLKRTLPQILPGIVYPIKYNLSSSAPAKLSSSSASAYSIPVFVGKSPQKNLSFSEAQYTGAFVRPESSARKTPTKEAAVSPTMLQDRVNCLATEPKNNSQPNNDECHSTEHLSKTSSIIHDKIEQESPSRTLRPRLSKDNNAASPPHKGTPAKKMLDLSCEKAKAKPGKSTPSVKSPIKVEVTVEKSPPTPLVSPIWPNHLDINIESEIVLETLSEQISRGRTHLGKTSLSDSDSLENVDTTKSRLRKSPMSVPKQATKRTAHTAFPSCFKAKRLRLNKAPGHKTFTRAHSKRCSPRKS